MILNSDIVQRVTKDQRFLMLNVHLWPYKESCCKCERHGSSSIEDNFFNNSIEILFFKCFDYYGKIRTSIRYDEITLIWAIQGSMNELLISVLRLPSHFQSYHRLRPIKTTFFLEKSHQKKFFMLWATEDADSIKPLINQQVLDGTEILFGQSEKKCTCTLYVIVSCELEGFSKGGFNGHTLTYKSCHQISKKRWLFYTYSKSFSLRPSSLFFSVLV